MEAYGGVCACCGEDNLDFLTLDHVNGDGAAERLDRGGKGGEYARLRSQGFPGKDRYQVLCWNCNCAKGVRDACPCRTYRRNVTEILQPGQLPLF